MVNVLINLTDGRLGVPSANTANRNLQIRGKTFPSAIAGQVLVPGVITGQTDSNGQFELSSLAPGIYEVRVQAPPCRSEFTFLIESQVAGTVSAGDYLVADASASFPAGQVSWAAAVTDQRYIGAIISSDHTIQSTGTVIHGTLTFDLSGSITVDAGAFIASQNGAGTHAYLAQPTLVNPIFPDYQPDDVSARAGVAQVLVVASSGTAGANQAYALAVAGTNLSATLIPVANGAGTNTFLETPTLVEPSLISPFGTNAVLSGVTKLKGVVDLNGINGVDSFEVLSTDGSGNLGFFTAGNNITFAASQISVTGVLQAATGDPSARAGVLQVEAIAVAGTAAAANGISLGNQALTTAFAGTAEAASAVILANQALTTAFAGTTEASNAVNLANQALVAAYAGTVAIAVVSGHGTNTYLKSPALVSGVNAANAFSSIGAGASSEQFGAGAQALDDFATAVGASSEAFGESSAIGAGAQATGGGDVALGRSAFTQGLNSIAIGNGANTGPSHTGAIAIGAGAASSKAHEIVLGTSSGQLTLLGSLIVFMPSGILITIGSGDPNFVVSAPKGSLYLSSSGTFGSCLWVKESDGGGDTGWTSK